MNRKRFVLWALLGVVLERSLYFGVRAVCVLHFTDAGGLSREDAFALYAQFTQLVPLLLVVGAVAGARLRDIRHTAGMGFALLAVGTAALATGLFAPGIVAVALGSGFIVPAMVGQLIDIAVTHGKRSVEGTLIMRFLWLEFGALLGAIGFGTIGANLGADVALWTAAAMAAVVAAALLYRSRQVSVGPMAIVMLFALLSAAIVSLLVARLLEQQIILLSVALGGLLIYHWRTDRYAATLGVVCAVLVALGLYTFGGALSARLVATSTSSLAGLVTNLANTGAVLLVPVLWLALRRVSSVWVIRFGVALGAFAALTLAGLLTGVVAFFWPFAAALVVTFTLSYLLEIQLLGGALGARQQGHTTLIVALILTAASWGEAVSFPVRALS